MTLTRFGFSSYYEPLLLALKFSEVSHLDDVVCCGFDDVYILRGPNGDPAGSPHVLSSCRRHSHALLGPTEIRVLDKGDLTRVP